VKSVPFLRWPILTRISQLSFSQISLCLCVIGLAAYSNAIFHPFVHDDIVFIQNNPEIANLNIGSIIKQASMFDDSDPGVNTYYRPLLEIFYRLQYKLFGFNPYGYHFINIVFHIFNSILIFRVMNFIFNGSKRVALGIALLFLLHPVQTESVACVSGISNLVFGFFVLSSFYLYLTSTNIKQHRTIKITLYLAALFLFLAGLLAKEQAVVLPVLVMLYAICFPGQPRKRLVLEVGGFLLALAGYFIFRKWLIGVVVNPFWQYPQELFLRLLSIPGTILMYLRVLFWPGDLHYYRSTDILRPYFLPSLGLLALMIFVIRIIYRTQAHERRYLIFGAGWFIVSLLPVLNIIPLINEYSLILTAEHFLYLPMVGVLIFVFSLGRSRVKVSSYQAAAAIGVIAVVFMSLTVRQNTYWKGEIPLFERAVRFQQDFGRAHKLLAMAYYFDGQYSKAIEHYQRALIIMGSYVEKSKGSQARQAYLNFVKDIHFDLGHCYVALKMFEQSQRHYHKALDLNPQSDLIHNNLGTNYIHMGNIEMAKSYFEKAVTLNKSNLMAWNNLAYCYIQQGDKKKALEILESLIKWDSQNRSIRDNYQKLLLDVNK